MWCYGAIGGCTYSIVLKIIYKMVQLLYQDGSTFAASKTVFPFVFTGVTSPRCLKGVVSQEDIDNHNKEGGLWIVINDRVYDVQSLASQVSYHSSVYG